MINENEKGTSVVEFAIVAVLFFTLLFSIIDFALMGWANLTMQHAVREGTRYTITGQDDLSGTIDLDDPGTRYLADDRFRAMVQKIKDNSMGIFDRVLDPGDITIEYVDGSDVKYTYNYDGGTPSDPSDDEAWEVFYPGEPDDLIVVKLNCTWPVLTPLIRPFFSDGEYNFTVASTMKNELFPVEE
jgi:hypothetical protein